MIFTKNIKTSIVYITFWLLSVLVFAFIFRLSDEMSKLDVIYSIFFHISLMIGVWLNNFAISRWLKGRKYWTYFFSLFAILVFTVGLNKLTFLKFVDIVLPNYYFVSQFNIFEIAIIVIIYFTITSAISMSQSWYYLQQANKQMTELQKEKTDSELKMLKSQINPHFLFNSLNLIYSLTLQKDEQTPDVVLKLSDILRYVIYDTKQDEVSIKSEVQLLEKYITLQKYRVDEYAKINFDYSIEKDRKIAPLILLTLVENSFKHGIKADIENCFLNIKLIAEKNKLHFEIENNKPKNPKKTESKGVGLTNIKKRLELQYPNKHKLTILDENSSFRVVLVVVD